jgi:microcin C transport system substrate-binding protein
LVKKHFSFAVSILLIINFHLVLSCKKSENSIKSTHITEDLPWDGDPESIPLALRKKNPVASEKAVKGGMFRVYSHQYPKSLNYYLEQFTTTAEIFRMLFEPLTSYDPITLDNIPRIAKKWEISADKRKFTFYLDQNAKWSDGKPITSNDILFTYNTIMDKKNNTAVFRISLERFEIPIIIDDYTIEFNAKSIHWNNFDDIASQLYILPKHVFEGKDFNKINDEFPVSSGPYKLAEAKAGRYIKMIRRGDYWQRAYPYNQGRYNFDEIYFKVFSEESIGFQAMMKGDMDIYAVYKAATWVKEANGEKFDKNYLIKQRIFNQKPMGFQGWAINTRREIFKDVRVRKALAHLVDRKTMIEKLAYNEYDSTNSYYPDFYLGEESKKNPNEIIDYNPEKAKALLKEAGWVANDRGILEKDGKEFVITILDREKSTEKYFTIFMEIAKEVGIKSSLETTDLAAWSARMDKFDFDITWAAWGGGIFKDPEPMWHSKYADGEGHHNYAGLKIPEVDKFIDSQKELFDANKRHEIVRKIDQIIYKEYPYILLWHLANTRLIYWNRFGMPENPLGKYNGESFAVDYWWFDKQKNDELENAIKSGSSLPDYSKNLNWKEIK